MAPGLNAYIFANMYGRAKRVAASTVLIVTAGSVFTIWGTSIYCPFEAVAGLFLVLWVIGHTGLEVIMVDL